MASATHPTLLQPLLPSFAPPQPSFRHALLSGALRLLRVTAQHDASMDKALASSPGGCLLTLPHLQWGWAGPLPTVLGMRAPVAAGGSCARRWWHCGAACCLAAAPHRPAMPPPPLPHRAGCLGTLQRAGLQCQGNLGGARARTFAVAWLHVLCVLLE